VRKKVFIKSNKIKCIIKISIITIIAFILVVLFALIYSCYTGKSIKKLWIGNAGVEFSTGKSVTSQDSKSEPQPSASITKKQSTAGPNSPIINESQNVKINIKDKSNEK